MIIAAHIARAGVCAQLFEDVLMQHDLVLSRFILEEVERKLKTKFSMPADELRRLRRLLAAAAIQVVPAEVPAGACRDPQDLPILGTAVAGRSDLIVTVDKDLLALGRHGGIVIVRPGQFWRLTRP